MKKINLRGISEILSEKELKSVMGGSDYVNVFSSCTSRDDCGNECWAGASGKGVCKMYFPDMNSFDYYCACYVG